MKVLIIDDHVIVREGVRRLLAPITDIVVSEATTARDALPQFRAVHPDVVLLDLNLPNGSGLEILRRLLSEDRAARVLVFTMHSEPLYVARALDAGARGYVTKSAAAAELITAIQRVAAGGRYVEHEIASQVVLSRRPGGDPFDQLTTREVDIMRLLGEGKSLVSIADALGVTYKTVANSCSVIKAKLGVERAADLIRLAMEMREP